MLKTVLQCIFNNGGKKHQRNSLKHFSTSYASQLPDSFYNEKQKELQATASKLIQTEILPNVKKWEDAEEMPSHEIIKKFGESQLLGIRFDPEYGGLGLDYKYQAAYLEELGTIGAAGIGASIIGHTEITLPALARFGSDELKRQFLAPSIKGDVVSCLGVSEPHAGSDVANIKTSARRNGDDLIITGQKTFITNGLKADWMCLLANTSQGPSHKNKSLICVPMDLKGISRTKIRKLGWHSSDTAQIFLDEVRIPAKNSIIGEEGRGFLYQMLQFQEERLGMAIVTLKSLDNAIRDTIEYTQERRIFGESILDNQTVHFRLAELAGEIESLRALTYRAVDMMVNGEDVTRAASMVKLKAGRLSREVADSCLQVQQWGGEGSEFIERLVRDGRLTSIGGGADEIMLEIITKLMGISSQQPQRSRNNLN